MLLIKKEADVNAKDNQRSTPLHNATYEGHLEITKLLVEEEADINKIDKRGKIPLHKTTGTWVPIILIKMLKAYYESRKNNVIANVI